MGLSIKRSTAERVLEASAFLGVGLLLGAGLALLLAPKSGKGLREDIGQKLDGLKKRGNDVPGDLHTGDVRTDEATP